VSTSSDLLYADDLRKRCGITESTGVYQLTEDDIRTFARQWDPLPIHIGDGGHFGAVIASGVHTFAVFQRLAATALYSRWAIVAGRAVRNLELPRPVHAGDMLSGDVTIRSVGAGRNGRAKVVLAGRLRNQRGELVLSVEVDCYVYASAPTTAPSFREPAQRVK